MDRGTVLLIDDDLDMLLIGQRIFGRAGFNFLSARNGKEGLEKIKTERPDLILLDFLLPDIGGRQFLETLAFDKDYSGCKDIPVIILTARADFIEDLDKFYELGLKAYLSKPFGHRELVNVVDNMIRINKAEKRSKAKQVQKVEATGVADSNGDFGNQHVEEIRNSAHTVLGMCNMFLDSKGQRLTEDQRTSFMAIYNSCRRLVKIVDGIKSSEQKEKAELV